MKTIDSALENINIDGIGELESQYLVMQLMKLRNNKGLTQNQLAKEIEVSHTTIARIENFVMQPTLKMLLQILAVYDMTLEIVPKKQCDDHLFVPAKTMNTVMENPTKVEECNLTQVIGDFYGVSCLNVKSSDDYKAFLNDYLLLYIEILNKHKVNSRITNRVARFNKYIGLIFSEYYNGRHNMAYELFKEALNTCIDIDIFTRSISNNSVFYRGRKHKEKKFSKKEMFHIPFEKRFKVSTERYSYPGLPCLYLGSSQEVCATELGEEISNLTIARFIYHKNQNDYKMLDLTSLLFDFFSGAYENEAEKFLANLPLILICSTYTLYDNEEEVKFKNEYILPQLLLEYIINESIFKDCAVIGVKYFSVKEDFIQYFLKGDFYAMQKICNYVFPTQGTKNNTGHCSRLENMFEVAEIIE